MSLLACLRCATRFAVGLVHCPHCWSEDFEEAGVPKITTGGGVSHAWDHPADGSPAPAAAAAVVPEVAVPAAEVVTPEPVSEPEPAVEEPSAPEPEAAPAPKAKPAPTLSGPAKAS